MNADELYNRLKPIQETKGAYFNPDKTLVFELLDGLLVTWPMFNWVEMMSPV